MDLDWTLELEMDGFRLEFRLEFRLDLDWDWSRYSSEIGQGNSRSKQYQNQAASWKEGGEGEEGKRDLFFYTFLLERLDDEDEEDD